MLGLFDARCKSREERQMGKEGEKGGKAAYIGTRIRGCTSPSPRRCQGQSWAGDQAR